MVCPDYLDLRRAGISEVRIQYLFIRHSRHDNHHDMHCFLKLVQVSLIIEILTFQSDFIYVVNYLLLSCSFRLFYHFRCFRSFQQNLHIFIFGLSLQNSYFLTSKLFYINFTILPFIYLYIRKSYFCIIYSLYFNV